MPDAILATDIPNPVVAFSAQATASAVLSIVLPNIETSFTASIPNEAVLDMVLPVPEMALVEVIAQDTTVLPKAMELLNCLAMELLLYPNPPANVCLRTSDIVIHDVDGNTSIDKVCCPGLAYVRIGSKYPSSNFPAPDGEAVKRNNCLPNSYAVELIMGMTRCLPGMGTVAGPTCEDWTQAAITDANDLDAMTRALCCFAEGLRPGQLWLAGTSTATMTADCIERQWPVLVSVGRCC